MSSPRSQGADVKAALGRGGENELMQILTLWLLPRQIKPSQEVHWLDFA
jgi:hypothetical protein